MILGFEARVLVIGLASYALVSAVVSIVVIAGWRPLLARLGDTPPGLLARRLAALRSTPALAGAGASALAVTAFWLLEPDLPREETGPLALALAAAGVLLIAAALLRGLRLARSAARLRSLPGASRLSLDGCPLEVRCLPTRFPVVAVAGCLRPYLIVSSRITETCSAEELEVMVAHELAHLRARDNQWRLFFSLCPDLLAWTPTHPALERAWNEAAELAADQQAAGDDHRRRLTLAAALVKVARLARSAPVERRHPMAASALFRGEPIADRVRVLLAPPIALAPSAGGAARGRLWIAAGALVLLGAWLTLPQVYELTEALVRFGR